MRTHIMRSINHHSTAKELRIERRGAQRRERPGQQGRALSLSNDTQQKKAESSERTLNTRGGSRRRPNAACTAPRGAACCRHSRAEQRPARVDLGMLRPFNRRRRGRAAGRTAFAGEGRRVRRGGLAGRGVVLLELIHLVPTAHRKVGPPLAVAAPGSRPSRRRRRIRYARPARPPTRRRVPPACRFVDGVCVGRPSRTHKGTTAVRLPTKILDTKVDAKGNQWMQKSPTVTRRQRTMSPLAMAQIDKDRAMHSEPRLPQLVDQPAPIRSGRANKGPRLQSEV